ncbi:MAG: nuclear transport factor 2 family protein [Hyphomicrobiaceae bacterium]|jgi:hypothetical protein
MAIKLPTPIEIYFASGNATDAAAFEQCFAPDAVVRDEAKTITGLVAIKAWRSETKKKYRFTAEPVAIADRDGKVVVTAKVSGNFPGSPINLDHTFDVQGDRIVSLKIG